MNTESAVALKRVVGHMRNYKTGKHRLIHPFTRPADKQKTAQRAALEKLASALGLSEKTASVLSIPEAVQIHINHRKQLGHQAAKWFAKSKQEPSMFKSLADKIRGVGDVAGGKAAKLETNTDKRVYGDAGPMDAQSVYNQSPGSDQMP